VAGAGRRDELGQTLNEAHDQAPGWTVHAMSPPVRLLSGSVYGGRAAVDGRGSNARVARLADEERGHDQRDRGQQLHQNVERRTGSVLERIADGVADDGGSVRRRALAQHLASGIEQVTRPMYFFGVVPGAAPLLRTVASRTPAMVPTSANRPRLVAEQDADDDRSGDGNSAGQHHLGEGGAGADVHDSSVVRPTV